VSQIDPTIPQTKEIPTDLATQIGHLSTAETPEDLEYNEILRKVSPQQRTYCALRVRGFSSAAACRQLKINVMAASRWSNSEWFNAVCEEERKKWFEESGIDLRKELMVPLVGKAVDAISETLSSEDYKVRLQAANLVLETFFDTKRPIGRPRLLREEETTEPAPDLSDVLGQANQRVILLSERISSQSEAVQIRANAVE
jgi:hypothetical protein